MVRVKEFKFRPLVDDAEDSHDAPDNAKMDSQQRLRSRMVYQSVWNCDGEVIEEGSVDVRYCVDTVWVLCVPCRYCGYSLCVLCM